MKALKTIGNLYLKFSLFGYLFVCEMAHAAGPLDKFIKPDGAKEVVSAGVDLMDTYFSGGTALLAGAGMFALTGDLKTRALIAFGGWAAVNLVWTIITNLMVL